MNRRQLLAASGAPLLAQVLPGRREDPLHARWIREYWYQPGIEHGNPVSNTRFRVNSPDVVLHPTFGLRQEVRSSGMLQIMVDENPAALDGAELYLELWGGHPGTALKRVTPNGRTTYWLPEVGTAAGHCTHQYPTVRLKRTDLVWGHNSFQFACEQGASFWGHFIVEEACVRCQLPPAHPALKDLSAFRAAVRAETRGEGFDLGLDVSDPGLVERVEYLAYHAGYNENGSGEAAGWHGFTKKRRPVAIAGESSAPPFQSRWDVSMLPAQTGAAVRARVYLRGRAGLVYETSPRGGLQIPERGVRLIACREKASPFWSRANRRKTAVLPLDADPSSIARAQLHVAVWDGGRGSVAECFTLNGAPLEVAGAGRHDVIYTVAPVSPDLLRRGTNEVALLSDTEHHGIEVLEPGPALAIRSAPDGAVVR